MPTYEYECTRCGTVFELFQPITEPARRKLRKGDPRPCKCEAPVTRRIGTGGGIIFKGSGFYTTDYRSDSYKKAAKSDSDAGSTAKPSDTPAKPEKTSPAKPEKTSPAKRSRKSSAD